MAREQGPPAFDDFVAGPTSGPVGIDTQDDVEVIAHDSVSGDVDGEHVGEVLDARDDPGAAVREVAAA